MVSLLTLVALSLGAGAAPALQNRSDFDPGAQLNRALEFLERQRIEQEIFEERESRKAKVEGSAAASDAAEPSDVVTFELKRVRFMAAYPAPGAAEESPSRELTREALDRIAAPYIGRRVTLQDLYTLTEVVSRHYAEKGFVTCRAVLPPQRIHAGEVQVNLVEGVTGSVTIRGNDHTRDAYILSRAGVPAGEVSNIQDLNERLLRFNGTNDAQLRILMKAGETPGTTDYEIVVKEPERNQTVTVYTDNAGYKSNGRYRAGVIYSNRSLTGHRDAFSLSALHAQGSDMFGAAYSVPVSTREKPW